MIAEKRLIVDDLDDKILALLDKRFQITDEIGRTKIMEGIPVQHDLIREKEIVNRLKENYSNLDPEFIENVYALIFSYAIERQVNK